MEEKKLKLSEINMLSKTLEKIYNVEISATKAYKMLKLLKSIREEINNIEEIRKKLFEKYGEEKNGQISIKQENINVFMKELNEMMNEEVTINTITFKLNELEEMGIKLNVSDIEILDICGIVKE